MNWAIVADILLVRPRRLLVAAVSWWCGNDTDLMLLPVSAVRSDSDPPLDCRGTADCLLTPAGGCREPLPDRSGETDTPAPDRYIFIYLGVSRY